MYPERYPVTSQRLSVFLDDFLFANSCNTVPFLLRKVCSSTCVGPSVLTRESTWETQLDNLNHSNVGFKHIVATPGDNARCHPEFPGSYRTREVVLWTRLLSHCHVEIVFAAKAGRRKGRRNAQSICSEQIARARTRPREALKRTSDFIRRRSQLGACRAARSIDRSNRGRSKGDRTKREDSWVKKGNLEFMSRTISTELRAALDAACWETIERSSSTVRDKKRR